MSQRKTARKEHKSTRENIIELIEEARKIYTEQQEEQKSKSPKVAIPVSTMAFRLNWAENTVRNNGYTDIIPRNVDSCEFENGKGLKISGKEFLKSGLEFKKEIEDKLDES